MSSLFLSVKCENAIVFVKKL